MRRSVSLGFWCGCKGSVRLEGFEMLSVILLGRMLFCFGGREWEFRGKVLAELGGGAGTFRGADFLGEE